MTPAARSLLDIATANGRCALRSLLDIATMEGR